jgi:acyl-CoA dehydrogenase
MPANIKVAMPRVLHDVAARALQVHGCLGGSNEMPFGAMVIESFTKGLADGPTEVHKVTLARQALRTHSGTEGLFPTTHLPSLRDKALKRYAKELEDIPPEYIRSSSTSTYR